MSLTLSPGLVSGLEALGRSEGATLFMTLVTAFQVLLYRCTGQADLIVGIPVANRDRLETERLIGLFVNLLPLRVDLSGSPTCRRVLARCATTS